jgi:hypothetical protein
MSFAIPAWATHASAWLASYGPIGWVAAGFAGLCIFVILAWVCVITYGKIQLSSLNRRLLSRADAVNPLDTHFHRKRIFLQSFLAPSGDPVEGKTFSQCEIVGPLNIIPFGCLITKSLYVSSDYIMVSNDAINLGTIRNGHVFRNCQFTECKFYFVSFLISEAAFELFDRAGGCNWITHIPVRQLDLLAPATAVETPQPTKSTS